MPGQLARLLDVAEHHGRGRAQPGAVRGLDDLHPARDRQLVRRDALRMPSSSTSAAVPGVEPSPDSSRSRRPRRGLLPERSHMKWTFIGERREVDCGATSFASSQPGPQSSIVSRGGCPPACRSGGAELDRFVLPALRPPPRRRGRRRASAAPGRIRRRRSRRRRAVGELMLRVDYEGHGVARQLRPQLVGGDPHLLDRLRPRPANSAVISSSAQPLSPLAPSRPLAPSARDPRLIPPPVAPFAE